MSQQAFTRYPGNTETEKHHWENPSTYTGGSRTASTADFFNSIYERNTLGGSDATDTTATAVAIIGMMEAPVVGTSIEFIVLNHDPSNNVTVAGGSGVTTNGNMVVGPGLGKRFLARVSALGPISTPAVVVFNAGGFTL